MKHSSKRTGIVAAFAPVLAVWTFIGLVGMAGAQEIDAEQAQHYQDQTLRVSLWLDKDADQVYRRGEPVEVTFQTNEDAYAVLCHLDVDGRVSILWPTSRLSDGFVFGGHQYRLPSRDGMRLRVGDEQGVGYVQAVVSRYPFDLRDLELDFHHENGGPAYDYYVAGDPFLAMNEVNYAVTGLEDASAYAVTNYVDYYVHQKVDHPRYLCFQCHDDADYQPYLDNCTVTIQYDHGWHNEWWVTYGYYPTYYYPTYYYVDPWTGGWWVNYWYRPYYRWPAVVVYDWPYRCYDWRYSPYWRCDAGTVSGGEGRRYTPLDRSQLGRDSGAVTRTKNTLVTAEKPADDRLRSMRDRTVADRGTRRVDDARLGNERPAGGTTRNVSPVSRSQVRYEQDQRIRTSPGLRVPGRTTVDRTRTTRDDRTVSGGGRQAIRPVEPRGDSGRVWTNRRNSSSTTVRPQSPTTRSTTPQRSRTTNIRRPSSQRKPQPASPGNNRGSSVRRSSKPSSPPAKPRGGTGNSGSSGSSVRRSTKQNTSQPASPPPSRSRSGSSSGRSSGSSGSSRGSRSTGGRG